MACCPRCGTPLGGYGPGGLCAKCLLLDGFGEADPHLFGDYELIEEIARGGMGVVWKARQVSLNRTVAVKWMLAGALAGPEERRRFRAEAEAAASLRHPHIVAIHEIGELDGQPYFSMDYVAGPNLAQVVRDRPLPPKRAATYLKAIAEAVHHAHDHGILHRDLKPSNLLIDDTDQPRITDFGLAKRLTADTDLTLSGQVLGSPNYLPPEQAEARHAAVGPASDVYALGAVLYFLLTARAPFQAATVPETLRQVSTADPVPPRLLNPDLPRDLETICLRCLGKEPASRYPTARDLAEELGRFLRNEPIVARPAGWPERSWRWCRRQPAVAALAASLGLVFLLGFAGVTWQWRRAENQARRAERGERAARHNLYAADLNLALRALEENNRGRATDLLDRHQPRPGEDDLRSWEWHHLRSECRGKERLALGEFPSPVTWVTFSPDSRRLAAGDVSGRLRLWDAPFTGSFREVLIGDGLNSLYFLPDSSRLLIAHFYRRGVDVWNLDDNRIVATLRPASDQWPHHMAALSPRGDRLAIINDDGRFEVWDARTFTNLVSLPGSKTCVRGVEWSPDGRWIASGEQGNVLYLRDGDSYEKRFEWPCPSGLPLKAFAFTRDGEFLAAAANDPTTRVWSTRSGRLAFALTNHSARVCALALAPDGRHLATASADQTLRLWDTTEWQSTAVLRGHGDEVHAVAYSPDGRWLVSGSKDGAVKLWDATPPPERPTIRDFSTAAEGLVLDPELAADGRRLVVWRRDGRLETWDTLRLEHRSTLLLSTNPPPAPRNQPNPLGASALAPGASHLALGYEDGTLRVYDLATHPPPAAQPVAQAPEHARLRWERSLADNPPVRPTAGEPAANRGTAVSRLAFSLDGTTLAGTSEDHSIRVWDVASGVERARFDGHWRWHFALAVSPDGTRIAAGNENHAIRWWRLPEGTPGGELRAPHLMHVRALAFSPDGTRLASASLDNRVRLWDLRSNTLVQTFSRTLLSFSSVTFTPDGRRVLAGTSGDGRIQLWDAEDGQELGTLRTRAGRVSRVVFANEGTLVSVTGPELRLWPVASVSP